MLFGVAGHLFVLCVEETGVFTMALMIHFEALIMTSKSVALHIAVAFGEGLHTPCTNAVHHAFNKYCSTEMPTFLALTLMFSNSVQTPTPEHI